MYCDLIEVVQRNPWRVKPCACLVCTPCSCCQTLGEAGRWVYSKWVMLWVRLVFLSQGFTTLRGNWGGKLRLESVTSEVAQSFCPGVLSKDIFFLRVSDSVCFDRIADSLYFLCVYQNVFYMLTWQNYTSQNKQMTNSRVYFNLGQLLAAVCTHREKNYLPLPRLSQRHPPRGEGSFRPTESWASLKAGGWVGLRWLW